MFDFVVECCVVLCVDLVKPFSFTGYEQVCRRVGTRSESELEMESDNSSFDGYKSDNDELIKSLGEYHSEDDEDTTQSSDSADDTSHAEEDSMSDSESKEQRSRNRSFSSGTLPFHFINLFPVAVGMGRSS